MKRRGAGSLGTVALIMLGTVLLAAMAEAQTSGPGGPVSPSPPESGYVVKKGDTLWGIAKSLLSDPFLWPQIWERNPFITNPNRIFPGDTLSVPGREAQAPVAQAPVPEVPQPEPPAEAPPTEAPKEAEAPAPTPPAAAATPEIAIAPIPPVPPASQTAIACSPVLLQEGAVEAAGIGSIVKSEDNRLLVSLTNTLYIGLDKDLIPQVGDRLTVIRQGTRAFHPWRKNALGRALITLGILEVKEVRGRTVRASVIYSCAAMSVGDRVGPLVLTDFPEDKIPQPTSRELEGFIVSEPYTMQLLGLQHAVYLDVGTDQGVGAGDVFAIYRPILPVANPATGEVVPIPPERLGEATVIRVTSSSSTAVITASVKDIRVGDQVVLSRQIQP